MKLNPYLNFPGNTEEAFKFYRSVFGGEFNSIVRFKDFPAAQAPKEIGNQIMHIGLPIGDSVLMATDAPDAMGLKVSFGNNAHISVHPDSRSEASRIFSALSRGGKVEVPIGDQPWGDYYGSCTDKFGVHWMVNYHEERR